ncbi:hypothetical protein HNR05_000322 [Leifsonia psychrotolerans]|uniref:MITD1 C-terminal phospholipase D-like domain-containing protein n=1 Tax=Glaciibacter psychrotolerans TaxID=670054 RepID=A0A7Z0J4X0_9MICO|nr:hypothetical protein [Leifsonia psychrotolerans]
MRGRISSPGRGRSLRVSLRHEPGSAGADEASAAEIEEVLRLAIEGRKRVKDQILRIDDTMTDVRFGYTDASGEWHDVTTLEEDEYPALYRQDRQRMDDEPNTPSPLVDTDVEPAPRATSVILKEGHHEFQENQRGLSYEKLILPYLDGAAEVTITDPYIRLYHQVRNLMELIEVIARSKSLEDEVKLQLITIEHDEPEKAQIQLKNLYQVKQAAESAGIMLDVAFDNTRTIHDRSMNRPGFHAAVLLAASSFNGPFVSA